MLRVGDTQSEKLTIPAEYKHKIVGEEKYCTKPELEILLIISEGLYDQYEKVKSKMKPKDFAKQNIKLGKSVIIIARSFTEIITVIMWILL